VSDDVSLTRTLLHHSSDNHILIPKALQASKVQSVEKSDVKFVAISAGSSK